MIAIFEALQFQRRRHGKHECYERAADENMSRKVVPIDDYAEFDETLIKSMIAQSGFTREKFYGATKGTKKKIS